MSLSTRLVNLFLTPRRSQIDRFRNRPVEVQQDQLRKLLEMGRQTSYGQQLGMDGISNGEEYARRVPVTDYESFSEKIERTKQGEQKIFWPGRIKWFAKSSGTTGSKSKYIPVSDEGLRNCHLQGPRDVIAFYAESNPNSRIFQGKTLTLGGSKRIEKEGETAFSGDLSAILLENTPIWANMRRVPSVETALIPDFEEKVRKICEEAVGQNVASFAGVPSWNLVMMNKVLEYTGKNNLLEVWPDLELFIYGGMNFKPYREEYRRIIPSADMKYMETYNASEGFFAIGDDLSRDDMLLMLDYEMYYEFLPLTGMHDHSQTVPLEGVRTGVNYAMIISNSNGLWRYMLGDTVEFTSVSPYRIKITGRTRHYINAFGEELVIDNAETAIHEACDRTGAEVAEFTAAPVYMEGRSKGAHEWVIEFRKEPADIDDFTEELDLALQRANSDYEAKRFKDTTLRPPIVRSVEPGTFVRWMESRGRIGGQNKVPRLFNDRTYVDEILLISKRPNSSGVSREYKEAVTA